MYYGGCGGFLGLCGIKSQHSQRQIFSSCHPEDPMRRPPPAERNGPRWFLPTRSVLLIVFFCSGLNGSLNPGLFSVVLRRNLPSFLLHHHHHHATFPTQSLRHSSEGGGLLPTRSSSSVCLSWRGGGGGGASNQPALTEKRGPPAVGISVESTACPWSPL